MRYLALSARGQIHIIALASFTSLSSLFVPSQGSAEEIVAIAGGTVTFAAVDAGLSADGERASVSIRISNSGSNDIQILPCENFRIIDTSAGVIEVDEVVGMSILNQNTCQYWLQRYDDEGDRTLFRSFASIVPAGGSSTVRLIGRSDEDSEAPLTGSTLSAGGVFVVFSISDLSTQPVSVTTAFSDISVLSQ